MGMTEMTWGPWGQHHDKHVVAFAISLHVCVHACMCVCVYGGTPMSLDTPNPHLSLPWGLEGAQISKNAITFEQIEIIQFHLKILDLCTFLQSYRLCSVCRWGMSHSKMAFLCFRPKKVRFLAQLNIFPFSHWNLIDHVQVDN